MPIERLHFSIVVNASQEKVWKTMLDRKTYEKWTEVFMPGSHYIGNWSKGSKILFLASDERGKKSGMVSNIKENRPFEYISIEHLGEIEDGKEKETEWAGALENYSFKEVNGKTEVLIDVDTDDKFKEMFQDLWPKALRKLKELAEQNE